MNEFMNQDHKTCAHEFPGVSREPLVCGLMIELTGSGLGLWTGLWARCSWLACWSEWIIEP